MGIRQKLWIGIGTLILILVITSGSAIWEISRGNRAIDAVFSNNGDAVLYMHEFTDGLDAVNDGLKAAAGGPAGSPLLTAKQATQVEHSLAGEARCLSEAGELENWQSLCKAWQRFKASVPSAGNALQRVYFEKKLQPQIQNMKRLAWTIAGLNLQNASFRDHGRQEASAEERWMALLLLSGVVLGVGLVVLGGRAMLGPILDLTRSAKAIEQGNLDLDLAVKSNDELGQLAAAFNSMAGRLKAFRRGVRARLLRTQKTTQMAINSFSDPVAVLSPGGSIDMCNRAASEIFGLTPGLALADSQLARLHSLLPQVLKLGKAYEPTGFAEVFQVKHHDREKFMLPRLVPVLDENSQVVGVTLFLEDVTALRKLDEVKSALLATVSHELKNPLTSLRLATHFLLEPAPGPLTPRQRELALTVQSESDRLHSILEELLNLGRIEAGKEFLQCSFQDPRALILEPLSPMAASYESKSLSFNFHIPQDLPKIFVDPRRLSHVFSNFYENAIKYSPPQGTVEIGAKREGQALRFWIKDSGPGIAAEYQEKIFERFFRVPGREVGLGSGLGLAIAKEIVELHGGTLRLESSEGQGATFSFSLPIQQAAPEAFRA